MEYKYANNSNYEDFASGRVIYHVGGEPTFPVRLSLEIYERCLQYSVKKTDITLYDCCCGGAYMLTILGLLKNHTMSRIYGSDVNVDCVKLAKDNLSLLTKSGLNRRREELQYLYETYKKASHMDALHSIDRIEKLLNKEIETSVFRQNILKNCELPSTPDIIITDVPYGNMVEWDEGSGGVNQMLDTLSSLCSKDTILCICMDKKQKIQHDRYQRLEKQLVGKRKFEMYKIR